MYDFSGAFGNLNGAIDGLGKKFEDRRSTEALLAAYDQSQGLPATAPRPTGLAALGQMFMPQQAQTAPRQPLPQQPAGQPLAALGSPNEVEQRFVGTVKQAGLTNPVGLGAIAAYGQAESGFSPKNVTRVWNDPSESGGAGQSGGIMSWRNERLDGLKRFAQERGEAQPSVETQALYLAKENPQLIPQLQAAKSPEEANQIMANAWRFAGYNRPGGENARRLEMTQRYSQAYGTGSSPVMTMPSLPPQSRPAAAVQVAQAPTQGGGQPVQSIAGDDPVVLRRDAEAYAQTNPEAARQLLARADAAERAGAASQVAADMPAPGAAPAQGFAVPGGQAPAAAPADKSNVNQQMIRSLLANPGTRDVGKQLWAQTLSGKSYGFQMIGDQLYRTNANTGRAEPVEGITNPGAVLDQRSKELDIQKKERELAGEGGKPMTPEQRAAYNVPEGVPAWIKRNGDPAFGPAGTKITNSVGATETKYAEANGKAISGRFEKIVEEGDAAAQEAGMLAQLRNLGGQIKNMGSGAALQAKLADYGIKVGENVSEIEAYGALVDKLTPAQRIAGSGTTSDFDAKTFKSSLPSLMRTTGGNEIILGTLEALNTYKRQRADIAAEAMANNEKPAEVIKRLKELPDPFAAFKESRKTAGQGGAQGGQEKPAAGADWQDLGGGIRIRQK